ncbi:hypothetical protein BYT27DRAFT_7261569 [Phlegmacium glaucopus]|nr:hypothetical protein BYT27DRAFT_7262707 [Phlegmacium glaucopus]KAF8801930.1 hypothetical protein BYT27DRAFT_7261569 [Phlegmacium glaucopus]
MSAYTPTLIRDLIDDLDAIFRAAVANGTIEKNASMGVARETWDSVEIQEQFKVPQFIWPFTDNWHRAKTCLDNGFWHQQLTLLEDFNKEYPNHHRTASMALV